MGQRWHKPASPKACWEVLDQLLSELHYPAGDQERTLAG